MRPDPSPDHAMGILLRGAFGHGGPLWRPLDRARTRARLLLLIGLLGALLTGCALAGRGVAAAPLRARAEAAQRHRVPAEVLGPVHQDATAVATRFRSGELVTVRWTYPAGHTVERRFDLPTPAQTGSTVPVWVDDAGRLADAPRGAAESVLLALGTGAGGWLALSLLGLALHWLHGRVLRRRTERYWAAGWAAVEPHWSGRLRRRHGS
ncbi:Rv1733c family protein [Kitasatospora viridis]|uniref:Uncharacterized protein n=1 Tax=Kitasatospora viridis TaxID=281105 RepID=A0A561UPD4_9ACTN|nr:hypothetical protein [Kitasatospora viridis]TWG01236.1 hypothetical protein FHX73_115128 [Kitasatospora viridis]